MLSAIAGGAVGAIFASLVGFSGWIYGARGDLPLHDLAIENRDEDLASWIKDRDAVLTPALLAVNERETSIDPRPRDEARSELQTAALHEWRDQERGASRLVAELHAREDWRHRLWRRRDRRPFPVLTAPELADTIELLHRWRQLNGSVPLYDPTRQRRSRYSHLADEA